MGRRAALEAKDPSIRGRPPRRLPPAITSRELIVKPTRRNAESEPRRPPASLLVGFDVEDSTLVEGAQRHEEACEQSNRDECEDRQRHRSPQSSEAADAIGTAKLPVHVERRY